MLEFWNLVFTQFNHDGSGNYNHVGEEEHRHRYGARAPACIMQGVPSLFDVDKPL
jgi:alanyl-tRNA synthetase